jgi:hypothetical protein
VRANGESAHVLALDWRRAAIALRLQMRACLMKYAVSLLFANARAMRAAAK